MSNQILAAENAVNRAYQALRRLSGGLRDDPDHGDLTVLLGLLAKVAGEAGLPLPVSCDTCEDAAAEVRRLRAEVSALAEADQIRDLEMQRIERLLPKDHDEDKETPVILAEMLAEREHRAVLAEDALVLANARRAQAERELVNLRAALYPGAVKARAAPDADGIEQAHVAAGARDCASHSRPPESPKRNGTPWPPPPPEPFSGETKGAPA